MTVNREEEDEGESGQEDRANDRTEAERYLSLKLRAMITTKQSPLGAGSQPKLHH